ncbi:tetratricopeptide repeat protein [Sulfurimonas aquatica]|uniref:Tetratricopeptide repeat protein n=1 Tax=Sulfurimonas aquatica TaxID=2672570 RepID=A0A975B0Y3_9BACT|nr:tetratricopeptide repeat protein [Sulfurimonas aquatica]QSZ42194.1 tetratricopeptide repeat protein [Sulfurimonas aquatica]
MTNNKTFRLFISSTFNDFRREREVLQTKVFPHIKEYASKQGYTFQPIDLRWGVSNEAQLDQKTLELCLSEVRACKTHMHPNFLIMIGDRYGWIPLPYAIETKEFEDLLSLVRDSTELNLLKEWYKLDLNQLPVSYILKERKDEYEDFERWSSIETRLRDILQATVDSSNLNEDKKRKYFLSATEAEVEEGILPYKSHARYQSQLLNQNTALNEVDSQHVFSFQRYVDKDTQVEEKFIGPAYDKAQAFKKEVKEVLQSENILKAHTKQIDKDRLDETYLEKFEVRMIEFLESQVDSQTQREKELKLTPLEIELQAQNYFAINKRKNFLSQEQMRKSIASYLQSDEEQALVIYGKSGRGKSALMSKAIEEAQTLAKSKVLYRFVSATPNSSSSKEILTSIFEELSIDVRSEKEKQTEEEETLSLGSNEDTESFEDFSQRIYSEIRNIKEEVVIFIDALDQLQNDDQFLWLPNNLPKNVKIVLSALEDDNYKQDSKYLKALRSRISLLHLIPEFNQPSELLKALLKEDDRTLQEDQEEYFLQQFKSSPSPLYVSIASQEIKNWKSSDFMQGDTPKEDGVEQDLKLGQTGIIQEFISNLSQTYHHNEKFVHKVLGYIYASRDGLSEAELLALISSDEIFVEMMAPETWHENPTKELPMVHWSRLHTQLKPFLSSKTQDAKELMYFFHREFEDAIKELSTQREEHEAVIIATQKLIKENQGKPFDENRWGRLYATLITEYELRYKDKQKQIEFARFVVSLKNEKWIRKYLSKFNSVGFAHGEHNRMYKAIAYQESYYHVAEGFYRKNPQRWVKSYTASLNNLESLYKKQNRISEAIALGEQSLKIREKLYEENPQRWAEYYTASLNNLGSSYKKQNRISEAIVLEEQSLKILEKLYEENPQRWAEFYTTSLTSLATSYSNQNRLNEAIVLQEKSLKILEKLYEENPQRWAEYYTASLNNLGSLYKKQHRINEAIVLEEQSLKIREKLYEENPQRWAEFYTTSLKHLAFSYKNQNCLNKAITLLEQSLEILEKLYEENPQRWAEDYTISLSGFASSKSKNKEFLAASELFEIYFEVLDFKSQDDITWFIYDFVKWYQCEIYLKNQEKLDKLNLLAIKLIELYREKLGIEYSSVIDELHDAYSSLKDSEENFDREKYGIFVKIFLEDNR